MNLVSGYSSPYYPANTHLTAHPHDFYNSPQNMGMSRYSWHSGHAEGAPTDTWNSLTHQQHSTHSPAHPATLNTDSLVGVAVNNIDNFHNGQYSIPSVQNGYSNVPVYDVMPDGTVKVRVVKRRNSANKKERRRTISINTAFSALRGCIPNVPSDTKLSKIKTLRLATSYIAYLMDILNKDDPTLTKGGFKAEITKKIEGREERRKREVEEMLRTARKEESKKSKGRTGWPQAVWASELKPEAQTNTTEPQVETSPLQEAVNEGSDIDTGEMDTNL